MAAAVEDSGIQIARDDQQDPEKASNAKGNTEHVHDSIGQPEPGSEAGVGSGLNIQTALAFIALCGQFNAYVMTMLIPASSLAYINADLGPDTNYTWITVSWQLGASVIVSVGGRLSDIFGRRYFMLTGSILGIIGCVIGATGQSINQMIASGVIFGIASGFQEMAYACIQEILPNKHRMVGVGIFDISLVVAYMSPVISYAFIGYTSISWRASYWYMFSFHTAMAVLLFFCYKPPDFHMKHRYDGKTKRQLLAELDYVGLLLFASASTLILLGINFGGRKYPWSHAAVIAPVVIGFFSAVALGFWEAQPSLKYPLLPPKLFKKIRGFVMVIIVCFVGGMLFYSMNVLWPQQSAQFFIPADKPIIRGVYSSIFPYGGLLGAVIMVVFCSKIGHEKWQLVGFMIAQTALIASMASVGIEDRTQAICTVFFGAAMITPPQLISFTMLSLGLDDQTDIGVAVGLAGTFRLLGGAIATAIYTAIMTNRFSEVLPGRIGQIAQNSDIDSAELLAAAKVNTAAAYAGVPGITDEVKAAAALAVKLSYVSAFKLVYLVAIAFGGLSIIAAFCTVSTDKALKNDSRAVHLKNEADVIEEKTVD